MRAALAHHASASARNRIERARDARLVGLLVAIYAAIWLLFAYRGARVAADECTFVKRPWGTTVGDCAFEHRVGGETYQTPWRFCTRDPSMNRMYAKAGFQANEEVPSGARLPCFYYVNDPADIFLEARSHRWATPWPLALAAAGSIAALVAQIVLHRGRPPKPRQASPEPDKGPYRGAPPPSERRPPPAPLTLLLKQRHWINWIFGGPFLILGMALLFLTLYSAWGTGGDIAAFFVFAMCMAHGSLLLGALMVFFHSGVRVSPGEGLLLHWRGIGPLRTCRAYDLADVRRVCHEAERGGRSASHYLVFTAHAPPPILRCSVEDRELGESHADVLNAFLAECRKPPGEA